MLSTLGRESPAVSRLGLGCMSMTGLYGPTDPDEAAATLLEALDSGVTCVFAVTLLWRRRRPT